MNQGIEGLIEKNDKSHFLVRSNLSVDLSKSLDVNGGCVSPIPNGVSDNGSMNSSESWNPVFGTSNKLSPVSPPGSRIVSWIKNCFSLLTPSKAVVDDDAKKTDSSLSEEVLKPRSQLQENREQRALATQSDNGNSISKHTQQTSEATRGPKAESGNGDEWVKQDKPGVYFTFVSLPGGMKDLKRVRFSRKRFTEKQAEQWWAANRSRVYQQYNVSLPGGIK